MGTNYYATIVPTAHDYQQMQEALANRQLKKLSALINTCTKEYHIGKRSCGWQFLFESRQSGAPWEADTLEAIQKFLSQPGVVIKNEYDEVFEPKIFWDEEVGESLYHDPHKYINDEDYGHECYDFTNEDGVRFSKSEFS